MKALSLILALSFTMSIALAAGEDLDDLQTIDLQLEDSSTPIYTVQYPGYRLGGGTPPGRVITDCLLLDIKDSDRLLTLDVKMALANKLIVLDGFHHTEESAPVLVPVIQGKNVVFPLKSGSSYLTMLQVKTKNGKSLISNLKTTAPTGLVYIRGCRF